MGEPPFSTSVASAPFRPRPTSVGGPLQFRSGRARPLTRKSLNPYIVTIIHPRFYRSRTDRFREVVFPITSGEGFKYAALQPNVAETVQARTRGYAAGRLDGF